MEIIIGNTPIIRKDPERPSRLERGEKGKRERRHNQKDRRKSVREGLIVTLSIPEERRKQPERRRHPS